MAVSSIGRPERGFDAKYALKQWGDSTLYRAMSDYEEWSAPLGFGKGHPLADIYPPKHREYRRRREAVEASLIVRLMSGELLGSGILHNGRQREIIDPSLWDVLEIDYDSDSVGGNGVIYEKAEFFEAQTAPSNILPLMQHLQPEQEQYFFAHDAHFRHVTAGGVIFPLGDEQRKVILFLYDRLLAKDPWQPISAIQQRAKIRASSMTDLFGSSAHWELLLISDTRRYYRIRNQYGMVIASTMTCSP